ncbi:putative Histone acetyltransferase GCN5 [Blattamonas nauphoetae]|uniref:Histone acetyltransferase GCN5 n=1 Tax=Blattamonas nauphoetae TaxID=2049346 RepID=A0ABQ9Y5S1_9EUKA|nr:putative Histone acetyltransferase GCN5 [Blattamonas nauphoetae]
MNTKMTYLPSKATTPSYSLEPSSYYLQKQTDLRELEAKSELFILVCSTSHSTTNSSRPIVSHETVVPAEDIVYLHSLSQLISRQLPKMPKQHIFKLVFDSDHLSIIAVTNKTHVIGGITIHVSVERALGEIAFCVVAQDFQQRGLGHRLMLHAKQLSQQLGLTALLTYADHTANGFFQKQGFNHVIRTSRERWAQWITDYDGATLMEYEINPFLDYLHVIDLLKEIRTSLLQRFISLPVVENAQKFWPSKAIDLHSRVLLNQKLAHFYEYILQQSSSIWPFLEPIFPDECIIPYSPAISLDLTQIRNRLRQQKWYNSSSSFRADLDYMISSVEKTTPRNSEGYRCVQRFQAWLEKAWVEHFP